MQVKRKEEIGLVMHCLVSRILLSALMFPISERWEAAEKGCISCELAEVVIYRLETAICA